MRNHYLCSVLATRTMIRNGVNDGLIVMISSAGGILDVGFGVPYAAGKAACDRMAIDMAKDLTTKRIYSFSFWPGGVKTEIMENSLNDKESGIHNWPHAEMMKTGESPRFSGRCLNEVLKRISNTGFMSKVNGKVVLATDISQKFSIKDIDGRVIKP